MAKRSRKPKKEARPGGWAFVLVAFGFGLLCIVVGAVVLLMGSGAEVGETAILPQDVSTIGYWMIGMGVAALALTVFIWRWGS